MRRLVLALIACLLAGCGQAAATPTVAPTATPAPTPTRTSAPTVTPSPTLAPAQLTAQAIRNNQIATQQATMVVGRQAGCAKVAADYTSAGRVFDATQAARDPEVAMIDYRIVRTGSGDPPSNRLGQFRDDMDRAALWACLGLPAPPIRPLT